MPNRAGKDKLAPLEPKRYQSDPSLNNIVLHKKALLTSLIPSLNGGGNTIQDNGEVQGLRVSPAMGNLHQDISAFAVFQSIDFV